MALTMRGMILGVGKNGTGEFSEALSCGGDSGEGGYDR